VTAEDSRPGARKDAREATPPPGGPSDDPEGGTQERRNAHVGEQVLRALGKPGDLLKVQVRLLWEKYYRVNVFIGADAASGTVAHSYFVVADGDGKVLDSTPKIERRY
jgi:hypothetical protein